MWGEPHKSYTCWDLSNNKYKLTNYYEIPEEIVNNKKHVFGYSNKIVQNNNRCLKK